MNWTLHQMSWTLRQSSWTLSQMSGTLCQMSWTGGHLRQLQQLTATSGGAAVAAAAPGRGRRRQRRHRERRDGQRRAGPLQHQLALRGQRVRHRRQRVAAVPGPACAHVHKTGDALERITSASLVLPQA
jgi:hypothetical protein